MIVEYTKKTILKVLLASLSPCLFSSPNILAKTTLETMIESIRVYSWFNSCKTIKGNENFNKILFMFPLVKFMKVIIQLRIYNLFINRGTNYG